MKCWMASVCLIAAMGTAGVAAAQNPFLGTWKLNQAKSHLTGTTIKFSAAGNGKIREAVPEGSFTFKTDGQSYPGLFGETEAWKQLGAHSWQTVVHLHGGYTATENWKLSENGNSLTVTSEGKQPDGSSYHDTEVFARMAGENGLMGTWKSKAVKMSSEETEEFAANGNNGLVWKIPAIKGTLTGKFDGKDYAPEGPSIPKGLTIAMTKTGPRSFSIMEKMSGKPIYKGNFSVSADGKTLTFVSSPVGHSEPTRSVYDKQI